MTNGRYERRGILVEDRGALPRLPGTAGAAIAGHAGVRGSGRVGRSASGGALGEQAVTLAVQASIRHVDTSYGDLLMSGVGREEARARTRPGIDRVLTASSKEG